MQTQILNYITVTHNEISKTATKKKEKIKIFRKNNASSEKKTKYVM